uniref:Uncharacterized protein n=1 Tax=Protohalopteris sp. TaxID=2843287 RepID=A0A8F0F7A5_9PHAE|nr:hypothetical protein [Protohalopteris sp.]
MSHYTSIQTKYTSFKILKKVLKNLSYAYTEDKLGKNIEILFLPYKKLSNSIYNNNYNDYLSLSLNNKSYNMITDSQSWAQKELIAEFLKDLELNYGYSETIFQALQLGFIRSKIISNDNNIKFIFQRCVEIKI